MRSKEEVVLEKFVVPQPAARFIQGLRSLVRDPGAENKTLRPGLYGMQPCPLEQRSADAAASNIRADEQIIQDPERLEGYGRERWVELGEPGRLSRTRVREIDHGFAAFEAVAKERACGREVRTVSIKLTVPIEKRNEVGELCPRRADDRDIRGFHRHGLHISRAQARRDEDSSDRERAGHRVRDRDPDHCGSKARDRGGHSDRADAGTERVPEDVRKLHR